MPSLFIYEYITGGGMWREFPREQPAGSLLDEGAAMVRAVTEDFVSAGDFEVVALRDRRIGELQLRGCRVVEIGSAVEEQAAIEDYSAAVDAVLVIAPEIDGALTARCREVEAAGGRLLGPDAEFVALASDKFRTTQCLSGAGVRVPTAVPLVTGAPLPRDFTYPAVLKPRDGAGSQGVWRMDEAAAPLPAEYVERRNADDIHGGRWMLESLEPGIAVSVAVLCGPRGCFPLPAWRQVLSDDGRFRYLGGAYPLPDSLDARARRLAAAAVEALSEACGGARGYLGVDLVLDETGEEEGDAVIEINPRLTTSYVGLRRTADFNLAAAMWDVAQGNAPPPLSFNRQPIRFQIADFRL